MIQEINKTLLIDGMLVGNVISNLISIYNKALDDGYTDIRFKPNCDWRTSDTVLSILGDKNE